MFSYEDRLRAVQLYIKLDKRIGLTIRQLGYPTKNALLSWHREYEQRLDLPAGYVRQPRYSQAHKELAVRHYCEHGRCIAATISPKPPTCQTISATNVNVSKILSNRLDDPNDFPCYLLPQKPFLASE